LVGQRISAASFVIGEHCFAHRAHSGQALNGGDIAHGLGCISLRRQADPSFHDVVSSCTRIGASSLNLSLSSINMSLGDE